MTNSFVPVFARRPGPDWFEKFPFPPLSLMEIKRLQEDTGFSPKFNTQSAIQHYVDWLKAGNTK
jgi:nucleoside-diphosphate-sugar epimerase